MKSWQLKRSGRENLHLIESPAPQPEADQILVRTKAVPLNYAALRLTDGHGADHILDVIGGDAAPRSIQASAWGGHIALIGFLDRAAATMSIPAAVSKNLRLQCASVGSRSDMKSCWHSSGNIEYPRSSMLDTVSGHYRTRSARSRSIWQGHRGDQLSKSPAIRTADRNIFLCLREAEASQAS
jgi:D-arabinose 1-dehydrogenase-like Zn-dependent alcohol dehydrogenase